MCLVAVVVVAERLIHRTNLSADTTICRIELHIQADVEAPGLEAVVALAAAIDATATVGVGGATTENTAAATVALVGVRVDARAVATRETGGARQIRWLDEVGQGHEVGGGYCLVGQVDHVRFRRVDSAVEAYPFERWHGERTSGHEEGDGDHAHGSSILDQMVDRTTFAFGIYNIGMKVGSCQ